MKKREVVEKELGELQGKYEVIFNEREELKVEVQKGVEDIAKALGEGYGRCLERVTAAGFDTAGHTFDDYVRDYAASRPG